MNRSKTPPPDNRLSFTDQLLLLGQCATGQELVMQIVWVYEHEVDMAQLRRFHRNFGHGLFGRLIERSPLPFGRHRWVAAPSPPVDLDIAEHHCPRAGLSDWLDECAQMPVDPERGPGWRLAVLPMADGATAVSLVMSHCLSDGVGAFQTIVNAVKGDLPDFGYPGARSRSRMRAIARDLGHTATGMPEVVRALRAAAGQGLRRRHEIARTKPVRRLAAPGDELPVVAPAISAYINLDDWDARADSLGGNSHSLLAGFAARLGAGMGRRSGDDGAVTVHIPISDRASDDTRANAASIAVARLDPGPVTTDLTQTRYAVRQALTTIRAEPDETLQLLPLTPLIPKHAVRRGSQVIFGFADLPVSCSNLGPLDPLVARIDGTDAEYFMLRGVDRHVTRGYLERRGGLLTVMAGRIVGWMALTVVSYQPGATNSKRRLREQVAHTLAEFGLTGAIE